MPIRRAAIVAAAAALIAGGCSSLGGLPSPVTVHPPGATAGATPGPTGEVFITGPYSPAEFWLYVVPGGENVEHYETLGAMTKAADAVVLGTVTAIRTDPEHYKSLDLQGMMYATLTLKVEATLSGTLHEAAPGELNLAIFMTDPRQYDRFAARLPAERAIFFLRNGLAEAIAVKQTPLPDDAIYYRVVSMQGLIRDVHGVAVPVTEPPFLATLKGEPFDRVVAQVKADGTLP